MNSVVIVAIPEKQESVWRISSETVPHLTILFLGEKDEIENLDEIVSFFQHAAKNDPPSFGLDVLDRGVLGDDKADVLFFKKNRALKGIEDFRSQLLKNDNIKKAFDSVQQFPEWTPHLTLGYPDKPAKSGRDQWEENPMWVRFNKLAIWTEDSAGVEVLLDRETIGDSMEDTTAAGWSGIVESIINEIYHFGIKGMRWGVRRSEKELARARESVPDSPDVAKAKVSAATIRKTGSTDAVSSADLQHLVNRMKLEQSYRESFEKANPRVETLADKGRGIVSRIIKNEIDDFVRTRQLPPLTKQVARAMAKSNARNQKARSKVKALGSSKKTPKAKKQKTPKPPPAPKPKRGKRSREERRRRGEDVVYNITNLG